MDRLRAEGLLDEVKQVDLGVEGGSDEPGRGEGEASALKGNSSWLIRAGEAVRAGELAACCMTFDPLAVEAAKSLVQGDRRR